VNLFLPKFCVFEPTNKNQTKCFCQHTRKCSVCINFNQELVTTSTDKIEIHKYVKSSKLYNYEGCQIPVNTKIDIEFMKTMLNGYSDLLVCDLLRYGFPIELEFDDISQESRLLTPRNIKNHSGARDFPIILKNISKRKLLMMLL
jgi:hypothetical protein